MSNHLLQWYVYVCSQGVTNVGKNQLIFWLGSSIQADEGAKYAKLAFAGQKDFDNAQTRMNFMTLSNPKYSGKMQVLVQLLEVISAKTSKEVRS